MCSVIFSLGVVFAALGLERIRWCTVSEEELSKCNGMSKAFSEAGILPPLECTAGGSAANCTQMIKVSCEWQQCHWFNSFMCLIIILWQGAQVCGECLAIQAADPLLPGTHGSEKSRHIFFRKDTKVYIWTWMSEWPRVICLAAHIWPVVRNTDKVLNISSQILIFDLGIVSDLFSRHLRRDGATRCRQ